MKMLKEDAKMRELLAKNARKMVAERFEQKYLWNELLKTYQKLTAE